MVIIEDYDAISRRLHELFITSPKGANDSAELERWRNLARQTAQEYVENRRREAVTGQCFESLRTDRSIGSLSDQRQGWRVSASQANIGVER